MSAPSQPMSRARSIFLLQGGARVLVLVPQVHDAARGPDREAGQHHPLDDEIGKVLEDHPVLERAGLTLVRVAHHVLRGRGLGAHQLPLEARGEAGASHAPQSALLQLRDQALGYLVRVGLRERHADSLVGALGIPVRVRLPRPVRPDFALRAAVPDHRDESVQVRGPNGHPVDPHSRSPFAAAQARSLCDLHVAAVGERRLSAGRPGRRLPPGDSSCRGTPTPRSAPAAWCGSEGRTRRAPADGTGARTGVPRAHGGRPGPGAPVRPATLRVRGSGSFKPIT